MADILRIQDAAGRGPWRPNFSQKWVDSWRTQQLPAIYHEIPSLSAVVSKAFGSGLHIGCAVRGKPGLLAWFSPMEIMRLEDLGFRIVDASGCEIVAETPHQIIIGSKRPLRELPVAEAFYA